MTLGVNILKCYEKKYTTEIEAYFCYVFTKEKKKNWPNYETIPQSGGIFSHC